ncbi:MAG: PTS transporter subunit EIIC [Spirochaetaceae bacterium]|jgi:PTS system cellobiose-specific IIC component|nr:PTS transporter subunit EIIC [Spirochaetaceae bacterium]
MANKAMVWLEESFAPAMNKAAKNIWVETIKDALMQTLPLILVGSLVTVFAILQDYIPNFPNLWTFSSYTMGLIGLFVTFLIPFNYMEKKKMQKMRILSGMTAVCLFALIIRLENLAEVDYSAFGAGGMFVSIIVGIITAIVMSLFANFSIFSKNSAIPDFVRFWFDSMIPIILLMTTGWFIVYFLDFNLFEFIQSLFRPLTGIAESFAGFVLTYFIMCFLYSLGISTWVYFAVLNPIMLAGIAANMAAVAAGLPATHIMTSEVVYIGFLCIGGTGATLSLVLMLMKSKSKRLKSLGVASFFPSLLNINEPVVFGCIAWNPLFMVAMWLQGIFLPVIAYIGLRSGLVPIPKSVFGLWYTPYPISSMVVSGVAGLVLFAILFAVSIIIWYPFFKVYEKQQIDAESAESGE